MIWGATIYDLLPWGWVLALLLITDLIIGDPKGIYDRLPHPVVWMGRFLTLLDQMANRPQFSDRIRKTNGILCLGFYLGIIFGLSYGLNGLMARIPSPELALGVLVLLSSIFLSCRSLLDHVKAVQIPLAKDDITTARHALGKIVGRDVTKLDPPAISRATIETLAENFSDGVIAPACWFLLAGFPGLVLYKAINTADSMIGYKNTKYRQFGWAAARLDDLVNYIPARFTALLMICASLFHQKARALHALKTTLRDSGKHKSPNAGWPEAAVAGAFDFKLGGPVAYATDSKGISKTAIWLGNGREKLTSADIDHAISLVLICILLMVILLTLYGAIYQ